MKETKLYKALKLIMFVFYGFGFIVLLLIPAHLLITLPIIGFFYFTGGEINDKVLSIVGGTASFCAIIVGLIQMRSRTTSEVIGDSLESKIKRTRAVILFIKRLRNFRIPRLKPPDANTKIENPTCWCGHLEKSHMEIKHSDLLDSLYGCHTCYSEEKIWRQYVWHSFTHKVSRSTAMAMINAKLDPAVDSVPVEIERRHVNNFLVFFASFIFPLVSIFAGVVLFKQIGILGLFIVAGVFLLFWLLYVGQGNRREFLGFVIKLSHVAFGVLLYIGLLIGFFWLMNATGEEGDYCPRCAPVEIYQEEMLSQ